MLRLPGDILNWDELLEKRRAVILGEPGSGKSFEMEYRAVLLKSQGKAAFFVRLDQLAAGAFMDLLHPDDKALFSRWTQGDGWAYLLLDSVDGGY